MGWKTLARPFSWTSHDQPLLLNTLLVVRFLSACCTFFLRLSSFHSFKVLGSEQDILELHHVAEKSPRTTLPLPEQDFAWAKLLDLFVPPTLTYTTI